MSVRALDGQRSFYHTNYLAGNLFSVGNRYRLFREKIWPELLKLRLGLKRFTKRSAADRSGAALRGDASPVYGGSGGPKS